MGTAVLDIKQTRDYEKDIIFWSISVLKLLPFCLLLIVANTKGNCFTICLIWVLNMCCDRGTHFNVYGSVHRKNILIYISNKTQRYTVYFIWKLLYMFRVVVPPETCRAASG